MSTAAKSSEFCPPFNNGSLILKAAVRTYASGSLKHPVRVELSEPDKPSSVHNACRRPDADESYSA